MPLSPTTWAHSYITTLCCGLTVWVLYLLLPKGLRRAYCRAQPRRYPRTFAERSLWNHNTNRSFTPHTGDTNHLDTLENNNNHNHNKPMDDRIPIQIERNHHTHNLSSRFLKDPIQDPHATIGVSTAGTRSRMPSPGGRNEDVAPPYYHHHDSNQEHVRLLQRGRHQVPVDNGGVGGDEDEQEVDMHSPRFQLLREYQTIRAQRRAAPPTRLSSSPNRGDEEEEGGGGGGGSGPAASLSYYHTDTNNNPRNKNENYHHDDDDEEDEDDIIPTVSTDTNPLRGFDQWGRDRYSMEIPESDMGARSSNKTATTMTTPTTGLPTSTMLSTANTAVIPPGSRGTALPPITPSPRHPAITRLPEKTILDETMRRLKGRGVRLVAHGIQCDPKRVWIRLDMEEYQVEWRTEFPQNITDQSGKTSIVLMRGAPHRIALPNILYVDVGKKTAAFLKNTNAHIPMTVCFSLLTQTGSLDLQTNSKLERDALVSCLSMVLDQVHPQHDWRRLYEASPPPSQISNISSDAFPSMREVEI